MSLNSTDTAPKKHRRVGIRLSSEGLGFISGHCNAEDAKKISKYGDLRYNKETGEFHLDVDSRFSFLQVERYIENLNRSEYE